MASTKNRKKMVCLKCNILLTKQNWGKNDRKIGYYICKGCRKIKDNEYHKLDPDYGIKQRNRYRMRRSAVIWAYGNSCAKCGEDDYTKLTINGNINFLYDNIVQSAEHQITCYNCNKKPYTNKYTLKYKKQRVRNLGGCCQECAEDKVELLTTAVIGKLLCYNCYMSKLAAEKYAEEHAEAEKQSG